MKKEGGGMGQRGYAGCISTCSASEGGFTLGIAG
jgi:hypothetical protein